MYVSKIMCFLSLHLHAWQSQVIPLYKIFALISLLYLVLIIHLRELNSAEELRSRMSLAKDVFALKEHIFQHLTESVSFARTIRHLVQEIQERLLQP